MNRTWLLNTLSFGLMIASCKTVSTKSGTRAQQLGSLDTTSVALLDANDVSFLVPMPSSLLAPGYLRLDAETSEGPILSEDLFEQAIEMGKIQSKGYGSWVVTAIRIDNCAKLLPQLPCEAQLRLVAQPWDGITFEDESIHLPYNIDHALAIAFYKDFIDLKRSAEPDSTKGPLDVHPVLQKQGMEGAYAKKLNSLVLKWAKPSKFERLAVMGTHVQGRFASWIFAASLPMKGDGKIVPSPIPCQNGETLNVLNSQSLDSSFPPGRTNFIASVEPEPAGCDAVDVNKLVTARNTKASNLTEEEMAKITDAALLINDPTRVFFASTTCVNCHLAGRRIGMVKGIEFLTKDDGNPNRFKMPTDVTTQYAEKRSSAGGNTWNVGAFRWNDISESPAISLYTFNDTLRVAHEINELIKSGKLD